MERPRPALVGLSPAGGLATVAAKAAGESASPTELGAFLEVFALVAIVAGVLVGFLLAEPDETVDAPPPSRFRLRRDHPATPPPPPPPPPPPATAC